MHFDIDIEGLGKPARGRRAVEDNAEIADFLGMAELVEHLDGKAKPAPKITRITERHHELARHMAIGVAQGEAATLVGMSASRASLIVNSPAFQELLDLYRNKVNLEFSEFSSRLAGLGKDAVNELQTRIEDNPEDFTNPQLLDLVKAMADRSGFGPSSKVETNINVNLSDRLDAARKRAKEAAMIDVTPDDLS